jgi:hypothetical protein
MSSCVALSLTKKMREAVLPLTRRGRAINASVYRDHSVRIPPSLVADVVVVATVGRRPILVLVVVVVVVIVVVVVAAVMLILRPLRMNDDEDDRRIF